MNNKNKRNLSVKRIAAILVSLLILLFGVMILQDVSSNLTIYIGLFILFLVLIFITFVTF